MLPRRYELPPSREARSLPVIPSRQGAKHAARAYDKKRKRTCRREIDAPRAFRRLMAIAQGKKNRSGLDNGTERGAVWANVKGGSTDRSTAAGDIAETPRIRPGEDLRSFGARVDAALPVSGLTKKAKARNGKDEAGIKVFRTRKERNMHKLYDQWRAEEHKIREKREEHLEREAERELQNEDAGILTSLHDALGSNKGRKKRLKAGQDDDPWLGLKKRRAESRIGLHDVAQAPPELHKKIRQQLRVGDASVDVDSVPRAAGSLRRREELQTARNDVVEAYRKIREHEQAKLDEQRRNK